MHNFSESFAYRLQTKETRLFEKNTKNSTNQIAVFGSRESQDDQKTVISIIGQITKLEDPDWSVLIT